MIYPILYYGEPILRRRARPVERFDADLAALAADMLETMYAADGVGLAAPQIGLDKRMFVALEVDRDEQDDDGDELVGQLAEPETIRDATHAAGDSETDDDEVEEALTDEQKRRAWGVVREHVVVNPVMRESTGRQLARDGCLSLPGLVAEGVPRPTSITLDYQDLSGASQRLVAEGYFAHVLQHEFDHLEGVLYFDRLPTASREAFMEEHRALLAEWQRLARARAKSASAPAPARAKQLR